MRVPVAGGEELATPGRWEGRGQQQPLSAGQVARGRRSRMEETNLRRSKREGLNTRQQQQKQAGGKVWSWFVSRDAQANPQTMTITTTVI